MYKLNGLSKHPFIRSVVVVASGTAAAQGISVVFAPVITRLYGPEAFGMLGIFNAIVTTIVPVASLTYVHAIVLPTDDRDAHLLLRLSLMIAVAVAGLCALFVLPTHGWLARMLGAPTLGPFLLLIPIVVVFASAAQAYSQWLIRCKRFKNLSKVAVVQALGVNILNTGAGLTLPTAGMLIGVNTVGHLFHTWLLQLGSRGSIPSQTPGVNQRGRMHELARQYRDFPIYRAPQVFLNAVSFGVPTILLSLCFGPAATGFFVLTQRVLQFPASLISQSVGKVFLPRIAEAARKGHNVRTLIVRTTLGLFTVGLVPFGLVIFFGPLLFGFVFGSEWATAGRYAQWLALCMFLQFANIPSVQAIPILGLQKELLYFEVVALCVRTGALLFGGLVLKSDVSAVMVFGLAGMALYVFLIAWVISKGGGPVRPEMTSSA